MCKINPSSVPAIVKAISAVERMFDEEERLVYEIRMQSLLEIESKIASAEEKGRVEGRLVGTQEGQNLRNHEN